MWFCSISVVVSINTMFPCRLRYQESREALIGSEWTFGGLCRATKTTCFDFTELKKNVLSYKL